MAWLQKMWCGEKIIVMHLIVTHLLAILLFVIFSRNNFLNNILLLQETMQKEVLKSIPFKILYIWHPILHGDDHSRKIKIDGVAALSTRRLVIFWRVCVCTTPQLFRPQFIVIALILRRFEKRHQLRESGAPEKGWRFQEFNRVLIKHTQIYKYSS